MCNEKALKNPKRCCIKSNNNQDEIITTIFKNSYKYFGTHDADLVMEGISIIYPKIPRMMARFESGKGTFDTYFLSTSRFLSRSIYTKAQIQCYQQKVDNIFAVKSDVNQDNCTNTLPTKVIDFRLYLIKEKKIVNKALTKKKIFILAMKCAYYLDENIIRNIAAYLGINEEKFFMIIHSLRSKVVENNTVLEKSKEKRDYYFGKIYYYEALINDSTNPLNIIAYKEKIVKYKKYLAYHHSIIDKIRMEPTNKDISKISGLPKGTIDSCIFYLKHENQINKKYSMPDVIKMLNLKG